MTKPSPERPTGGTLHSEVHRNDDLHSDVLIVGGGPIGLTLAVLLRAHGVTVTVVEAHTALSTHPKARGISARSMETYRSVGLEPAIRQAALPSDEIRFFRGDTLVDPQFSRSDPPATHGSDATPAPCVLCSQDALEPVLLAAARDAGADVRFGQRVTELSQEQVGVSAVVETGDGQRTLRARALIGCDGAGSTVRRAAGIPLQGERGLARFLSIRVVADLTEVVRDRAAASYFLTGGKGGFLAVDNRTNWVYQYPLPEGNDGTQLADDPAALVRLVRDAAGIPDLAVEVRDTMVWRMDARIADTYRAGRVFLAGDAAHQTPPTGGHGMNVGIGDADTLAWQLAAVLQGEAGEELLDAYSAERRPVGETIIAISRGNFAGQYGIDDELLLGTHYGAAEPIAAGAYAPSGAVGRRLPHARITGEPRGASTLDLVARDWLVLLADSRANGAGWATAAERAAVGFTALAQPEQFAERAGLAGHAMDGAVGLLVRPDGHIAARLVQPDEITAALAAAMRGAPTGAPARP